VSFAAITLCVASQRVFIVVSVHFVIDSVRKLLDTPSYIRTFFTWSCSSDDIQEDGLDIFLSDVSFILEIVKVEPTFLALSGKWSGIQKPFSVSVHFVLWYRLFD